MKIPEEKIQMKDPPTLSRYSLPFNHFSTLLFAEFFLFPFTHLTVRLVEVREEDQDKKEDSTTWITFFHIGIRIGSNADCSFHLFLLSFCVAFLLSDIVQ